MPQRNFGYHNRARQPTDRLTIEFVGADAYIGPVDSACVYCVWAVEDAGPYGEATMVQWFMHPAQFRFFRSSSCWMSHSFWLRST